MLTPPLSEEYRFWSKVRIQQGCWEWKGYINPNGYGKFSIGKANKYAHRMSFELMVGNIPDGMVVDHLCRNRKCVNPSHLELVTSRENVLRGEGITAVCSQKTVCLRGHELSGENVYVSKSGKRHCRMCHRERESSRRLTQRETRGGAR